MAPAQPNVIWILDTDETCVSLYRQTLGLHYEIREFSGVGELIDALAPQKIADTGRPRLLIADPENTDGSLSQTLSKLQSEGLNAPAIPDFFIVSRVDQLELMRFYLKAGARDYILKPVRPNELVAKIERAVSQISNREVFILRSDLDGVHIPDLTFREHQMLTIFLSRPNRTVARDELFGAIWGKVMVNRKTLDVHMFNLRRKLRPKGFDVVCRGQLFALGRSIDAPVKNLEGSD